MHAVRTIAKSLNRVRGGVWTTQKMVFIKITLKKLRYYDIVEIGRKRKADGFAFCANPICSVNLRIKREPFSLNFLLTVQRRSRLTFAGEREPKGLGRVRVVRISATSTEAFVDKIRVYDRDVYLINFADSAIRPK